MGFFSRLFGGGGSQSKGASNVLWLYVRCSRCQSPVRVRVNLLNDPSIDYETGSYVLRKEIMDSKCFQLITANLTFDSSRHLKSQTIENGRFITDAEFQAETSGHPQA